MKRFVKHILIFLMLFVGIFACLNLYQSYHPYEPAHYHRKYAELFAKSESSEDISGIIVGSSRVAYSLKPSLLDQTGIRFYNFAYGRADLEFYINWFEHILPLYDQPVKHCVLSVPPSFFNTTNGRLLEQDAEYFPKNELRELMIGSSMNSTSLFLNQFPAFKYRKKLWNTLFDEKKPQFFEVDRYDRGYIPFNKPYDSQNFERRRKRNVELLMEDQARFERLLDKLQDANMTIYLIIPPRFNYDSKVNANLSDYLKRVSKDKKMSFFDFNEAYANEAFKDSTYFSDVIHLNESGSDILSALLVEAINSSFGH